MENIKVTREYAPGVALVELNQLLRPQKTTI